MLTRFQHSQSEKMLMHALPLAGLVLVLAAASQEDDIHQEVAARQDRAA